MNANEIIKSKKIVLITVIVGIFLLVLISFAAGTMVGFKKAKFSCDWGRNYERNFVGPHREFGPEKQMNGPMGRFMDNVEGKNLKNAHGIAGEIISITDNSLVIKDRDNEENTITVSDETIIKSGKDEIKISDLKTNDKIIVMGKPGENGNVEADFIRVFQGDMNNPGGNSRDTTNSEKTNNPENANINN